MNRGRDILKNTPFKRRSLFGLRLLGCRLSVMVLAVFISPGTTPAQSSATPDAAPDASGSITLRWTAPGDDHHVGQASTYDIRWQLASRGLLDTETEWQAATRVPFLPQPSLAGNYDSVRVMGLEAGTAYAFALRTYAEDFNESLLSNSPLITAIETSCCQGRVGDANGLGGDEPTIGDISILIDHLFIDLPLLWCTTEADINQSGGINPQQGPNGDITISDIAILIDYLFLDGDTIPECL